MQFSDFEALRFAADTTSEIVQTDRGRMSGSLTHIALDDAFEISSGSFSLGMISRGVLSKRRWTIGMMTAIEGDVAMMRFSEINPGDLAILAPGTDRYVRYFGPTSYCLVFIDPDELYRFLETSSAARGSRVWRDPVSLLPSKPDNAKRMIESFQAITNLLALHGATMSRGACQFWKRTLLELLTQPIGDRTDDHRPIRSSLGLVRDVHNYVDAAGDRPVHVSELCERFKVSRRTLFRTFHDRLGISPIAFLRHKRLCDAHVSLASGRGHTVTSVALDHGFINFGRFASYYRSLFDERPSQTLSRTRTPGAAPSVGR